MNRPCNAIEECDSNAIAGTGYAVANDDSEQAEYIPRNFRIFREEVQEGALLRFYYSERTISRNFDGNGRHRAKQKGELA